MTRLIVAALHPMWRYIDWALTRMVRIDMDGIGTNDKEND